MDVIPYWAGMEWLINMLEQQEDARKNDIP
jgi:hypothetical protein